MGDISVSDISAIVGAAATNLGLLAVFLAYRKDRRRAELARQAEVHAHATAQWRELVKLAIDNEDLRPLVIRGAKGSSKEAVFFELVNVLMAYIRLVESREEHGIVGSSWVEGWRNLFMSFMTTPGFIEFFESQRPVYDDAMNAWIENLISDAQSRNIIRTAFPGT